MNVRLSGAVVNRGNWSLFADGVFDEGIHLVCGDVGSGKSTLALMIAGLLPPDTGTIGNSSIRSHIISFQFPEYHITGQDLAEECRSWNLDPAVILDAAGLAGREQTNPLDLSRGELKRLVISCILAREYDLLVLDEPFSSLDCFEKARLCSVLSERRNGITVIFTHEQSLFPRVDRIWEIEQGVLHDRGGLPDAVFRWKHAPAIVKDLVGKGKIPANVSRADLLEAACRI